MLRVMMISNIGIIKENGNCYRILVLYRDNGRKETTIV